MNPPSKRSRSNLITTTALLTYDRQSPDSSLPVDLDLTTLQMPDFHPQPGWVQSLYGYQVRSDALEHCYRLTHERGNGVIEIDLEFLARSPIETMMIDNDNLAGVDFVHYTRMHSSMVSRMAAFWEERLEAQGINCSNQVESWKYPKQFVTLDESIVTAWLAQPDWQHVRMFVYPAMPKTPSPKAPFAMAITRPEDVLHATCSYRVGERPARIISAGRELRSST